MFMSLIYIKPLVTFIYVLKAAGHIIHTLFYAIDFANKTFMLITRSSCINILSKLLQRMTSDNKHRYTKCHPSIYNWQA